MKQPEFIKDVEPDYFLYNGYEKKISMGLYKCECGQTFYCRKTKVKTGLTKSCGCLKKLNGYKKIKE